MCVLPRAAGRMRELAILPHFLLQFLSSNTLFYQYTSRLHQCTQTQRKGSRRQADRNIDDWSTRQTSATFGDHWFLRPLTREVNKPMLYNHYLRLASLGQADTRRQLWVGLMCAICFPSSVCVTLYTCLVFLHVYSLQLTKFKHISLCIYVVCCSERNRERHLKSEWKINLDKKR